MQKRLNRFLSSFAEINLLWHRIATVEMGKYGLQGTAAVYFAPLTASPEGLTAGELASACFRDKADVSRHITRMMQLGLVERTADDGKVYRAKIRLTEKGKQIGQEVDQKVALALDAAGKNLTDAERDALYRSLDQIAANLRTLTGSGSLALGERQDTEDENGHTVYR